jgi:hypothetical protein
MLVSSLSRVVHSSGGGSGRQKDEGDAQSINQSIYYNETTLGQGWIHCRSEEEATRTDDGSLCLLLMAQADIRIKWNVGKGNIIVIFMGF